MARYARRRKSVRPFRAMRKARAYRSSGLGYFGRTMYGMAKRVISNQIHNFRKQIMLDTISESGTNQHLGYQFNLAQLADEIDFKNMYDSYRIKKVVLSLEPVLQGSNGNATPPYNYRIRVVHDYDDVTPLTSETQYLEYGGCKSHLVTSQRLINIPLYPKIQQFLQATPNAVLRPVKSGWIPTSHDTVEHLGLKIFVPTIGITNGYGIFRVRATFIMQFKNTK